RLEKRGESELGAAGPDALDRGGAHRQDGQPTFGDGGAAARQPVVGDDVVGRDRAGGGRGPGGGQSGGEQGENGGGRSETDGDQGFGVPVAGSTAVSPELEEPSEPLGSWAGRGGWPSLGGRRSSSYSFCRPGARGVSDMVVSIWAEVQRPAARAGSRRLPFTMIAHPDATAVAQTGEESAGAAGEGGRNGRGEGQDRRRRGAGRRRPGAMAGVPEGGPRPGQPLLPSGVRPRGGPDL